MKVEGIGLSNNTYVYGNESQNRKGDNEDPVIDSPKSEKQSLPGEKQLIDAIVKANEGIEVSNTSLQFSIHEQTKQILVKIVNNDTKEVLREIPSEKILDIVASMLERTGVFLDKRA